MVSTRLKHINLSVKNNQPQTELFTTFIKKFISNTGEKYDSFKVLFFVFITAFIVHGSKSDFKKMLDDGKKINSDTDLYNYLEESITQEFDSMRSQALLTTLTCAYKSYFFVYKNHFTVKEEEKIQQVTLCDINIEDKSTVQQKKKKVPKTSWYEDEDESEDESEIDSIEDTKEEVDKGKDAENSNKELIDVNKEKKITAQTDKYLDEHTLEQEKKVKLSLYKTLCSLIESACMNNVNKNLFFHKREKLFASEENELPQIKRMVPVKEFSAHLELFYKINSYSKFCKYVQNKENIDDIIDLFRIGRDKAHYYESKETITMEYYFFSKKKAEDKLILIFQKNYEVINALFTKISLFCENYRSLMLQNNENSFIISFKDAEFANPLLIIEELEMSIRKMRSQVLNTELAKTLFPSDFLERESVSQACNKMTQNIRSQNKESESNKGEESFNSFQYKEPNSDSIQRIENNACNNKTQYDISHVQPNDKYSVNLIIDNMYDILPILHLYIKLSIQYRNTVLDKFSDNTTIETINDMLKDNIFPIIEQNVARGAKQIYIQDIISIKDYFRFLKSNVAKKQKYEQIRSFRNVFRSFCDIFKTDEFKKKFLDGKADYKIFDYYYTEMYKEYKDEFTPCKKTNQKKKIKKIKK